MMHRCNQCGEVFTRKFNLQRHEDGRCRRSSPLISYPSTSKTEDVLMLPVVSQAKTDERKVQKIPIESQASNVYVWKDTNKIVKNHSPHLPRDIRAIIVGKSGSGKTYLLMTMLLAADMLDYDNLIVCGNSLHQKEYDVLNKMLARVFSKGQIAYMFNNQPQLEEEYGGIDGFLNEFDGLCKGGIDARFLDNVADIPDPREHENVKIYWF